MNGTQILVQGKRLTLSNLDKVLYPAVGYTKAQVINYYTRIAPALLPHLRDRPLTLKRYPDGVDGEFFYEKQCPDYKPEWVLTTPIWSDSNRREVNYCVVNDLPTLVWLANLADLELHTSLSVRADPQQPTMMVFDLDPGTPADIIDCAAVALRLKELFDGLGLACFPKTSGSKGMQIYVPLNTPCTYDDTKAFSRTIAQFLERKSPQTVTSVMKKSLRAGKIFIDWSQNDDHKTTVCVYSLRAGETPTVSTPIAWGEVSAALHAHDPQALQFSADEVLARIDRRGDLFAPVLTLKQRLPSPDRALAS
jgi:bifunctional non-homologous end joining protein LigD